VQNRSSGSQSGNSLLGFGAWALSGNVADQVFISTVRHALSFWLAPVTCQYFLMLTPFLYISKFNLPLASSRSSLPTLTSISSSGREHPHQAGVAVGYARGIALGTQDVQCFRIFHHRSFLPQLCAILLLIGRVKLSLLAAFSGSDRSVSPVWRYDSSF
jgi:hypothetical protein